MLTDRTARAAGRRLLAGNLGTVLALYLLAITFSLVLTSGVAVVQGPIEVSGWSYLGPMLVWAGFGFAVASTHVTMPEHVAHGRSRREFAAQQAVSLLVSGAVLGALITVGYLLESGYYTLMDWPQELRESDPYSGESFLPAVGEYAMIAPVWLMVGAAVGAAFYRGALPGFLGILTAFVGLSVAASVLGTASPYMPWVEGFPGPANGPLPIAATCTIAFLAAAGANWALLRTAPVRSRPQ